MHGTTNWDDLKGTVRKLRCEGPPNPFLSLKLVPFRRFVNCRSRASAMKNGPGGVTPGP